MNYICANLYSLMNSKENPDDFYERFQHQLEESQDWPGPFMFKFIVKSNSYQIENSKNCSIIQLMESPWLTPPKNKFQSLTVTIEMKSPLDVIAIYKKASEFEGVIIL